MIVQQRRVSKSRKGMRRSHHALEAGITVACSKCGQQIKPHTVCSHCGYYKNKKIMNVKSKS
ncbi:MAG: 50S ribosomal protein L32 [Mycoplasmataceae bacterium]|jgi:large subunit ribosomal protein L32|nr:50S ribosomal protein L32 [Mycoplasmataceae bacterium]